MPALVMRSPEGGLLSQTYELIVRRQIEYGEERGLQQGVSESAYNARDVNLNYQYSSFGVPGLGLKRGLSEDVVGAPYATALAAIVDPASALQNFRRLEEAGGKPAHMGFTKRLTTPAHDCPRGERVVVVQGVLGASPGNVAHCYRKPAKRRRDAQPFSCRSPWCRPPSCSYRERTPRDVLVARRSSRRGICYTPGS